MKKKLLIIPILLILFGVLLGQSGNLIRLFDTNFTDFLTLTWNENDTSARTLNFLVNAGNRTVDLSGNLTVESASLINQDLTTDSATALLATLTMSTSIIMGDGNTIGQAAGPLLTFNDTTNILTLGGASFNLGANTIIGSSVDINNAEMQQLSAIGGTTISSTQWGYLGASDQGFASSGSPSYANLSLGTGELTAGSINRASGTLTFEIGGTAEVSITSTLTTFGGDILADTARLSDLTDGFLPYHVSDASGLANSVIFQTGSSIGISTENPAQEFDLLGNMILAQNKTATTNKNANILVHQYDIAAEPEGFSILGTFASTTLNRIDIGGGNSGFNAATDIKFHTAANNTTRTGTERLHIDSAGVITSTQNSDTWTLTGDGSDWDIGWSDGQLNFIHDATNSATQLNIKPNGTSEVSALEFYDTNTANLLIYTGANRSYIRGQSGALGINEDAAQNVTFFESAASGETKEVIISGFRAADSLRSLEIGVGVDAADQVSFDGLSTYYFDGILSAGGNLALAANSITGTSVDINNAELQQLSAIAATTISGTQWGYLGATGAGGGQFLAAITTGESTQLEAIGAVTINVTQWGYLGASDQGFATSLSPSYANLSLGTGELTAGSINRASGTMTLEIGGVTVGSISTSGFTVTANSDVFSILPDGTDVALNWSDGELNLITDEGTNTYSIVNIKGKGVGGGRLLIYEEDDSEWLYLDHALGIGYIESKGATPGPINMQLDGNGDVSLFGGVDTGETPTLNIWGFQTAVGLKSMILGVNGDGNAVITTSNDLLLSGIPTTDAGDYDLRYDAVDGITYDTSDIRQKSDIQTLTYGLDEIMQLNPKRYFYNNAKVSIDGFEITERGNYTIGLIAQEVYGVIPDAVYKPEDESKHLWGLNEDKLIPVLINAIQEQQVNIETLEARITQLENLILRNNK